MDTMFLHICRSAVFPVPRQAGVYAAFIAISAVKSSNGPRGSSMTGLSSAGCRGDTSYMYMGEARPTSVCTKAFMNYAKSAEG